MINLYRHKLADLYEMNSGISSKPEQAGHGAPFLSFSTVFSNYFLPKLLPDLMDASTKEKTIYSIKEGDIFLTRTSETLDELGMSCVANSDYEEATYSGFLKRLRPKNKNLVYHKFMAFYLRGNTFRKMMNNNAIMTLRASLNEQIFSYLTIEIPEYKEQKKIGDFLFLLNKKIELNKEIAQKLDELARKIYSYWFIQYDFPDNDDKPYKENGGKFKWDNELNKQVPNEWLKVNSINYFKIVSGFPFNSKDYSLNGEYKIITIKNVQDSGLDTNKVDRLLKLPENLPSYCYLKIKDILISLTGNVGRICLVPEKNLLLNQRVGKIICEKAFQNYLYLTFLRPEERSRFEKMSTGTSQKNLSPIDAVAKKMILPPNDVLEKFNKIIDPILEKYISCYVENQKLVKLRDWISPMLMNGQVKVN